jgi:hypothetical protein
MTGKQVLTIAALILCLAAVGACAATSIGKDAPRITKEELRAMVGKSDVVIVDVRTTSDWNSADSKIQGAVREDSKTVNAWAGKYPKDKTLVFYCA